MHLKALSPPSKDYNPWKKVSSFWKLVFKTEREGGKTVLWKKNSSHNEAVFKIARHESLQRSNYKSKKVTTK